MTIAHASIATAGTHGPSATAVTQVHGSATSPILVLLLAFTFLAIVMRANSGLVNLVSQLVQLAVAVGRTLLLLVLFAGFAAIVLLHL